MATEILTRLFQLYCYYEARVTRFQSRYTLLSMIEHPGVGLASLAQLPCSLARAGKKCLSLRPHPLYLYSLCSHLNYPTPPCRVFTPQILGLDIPVPPYQQ